MSGQSFYDPLYVAFLYYFNRERDYFECHEVMEALWLEEGRDALYQGLLQVAVSLHHHRNDNIDGAVKLMNAAIDKLEGRDSVVLGIDLNRLIIDAAGHLSALTHNGEIPFHFQDMDIRILDPALNALIDNFDPATLEVGH